MPESVELAELGKRKAGAIISTRCRNEIISNQLLSFAPQGFKGVEPHGGTRRKIAGDQGGDSERERHEKVRKQIG